MVRSYASRDRGRVGGRMEKEKAGIMARMDAPEVSNVVVSEAISFFKDREVNVDLGGLRCLGSQVGGHVGIFLVANDGKILKRCIPEELDFYRFLARENIEKSFFPRAEGTLVISLSVGGVEIRDQPYLVMEDLTSSYKRASVLDVKVGTQPWGKEVSGEKLAKQLKKRESTTTGKLGFRVTGMKIWKEDRNQYEILDRSFGHNLQVDEVPQAMKKFLHNGNADLSSSVVPSFLQQLKSFVEWEQSYGVKRLGFHGSSLLFIYEASTSSQGVDSNSELGVASRVCMIDFPHTEYFAPESNPAPKGDHDGVSLGVANLISILENILRNA